MVYCIKTVNLDNLAIQTFMNLHWQLDFQTFFCDLHPWLKSCEISELECDLQLQRNFAQIAKICDNYKTFHRGCRDFWHFLFCAKPVTKLEFWRLCVLELMCTILDTSFIFTKKSNVAKCFLISVTLRLNNDI